MSEKSTEAIYKKVGRKYIPVSARWYEDAVTDQMTAGAFRLTYAHADGCRRFEYDVVPSTAREVASMMVAQAAIEDAIRKACTMQPNTGIKFTKKQLALIDQFKLDMGMQHPRWWTETSARDISTAAIKALMEFQQ